MDVKENDPRWWFQIYFYFHPDPWGNDPIWRSADFSIGLVQPPTRLHSVSSNPFSSNIRRTSWINKSTMVAFFVWMWVFCDGGLCRLQQSKFGKEWFSLLEFSETATTLCSHVVARLFHILGFVYSVIFSGLYHGIRHQTIIWENFFGSLFPSIFSSRKSKICNEIIGLFSSGSGNRW